MEQQTTLALWDGSAPGALGTTAEDCPAVQVFLPRKLKTGSAMIVCPGGGYHHRSKREGQNVGEWLSDQGIAAFVLRYRVAPYRHPAALLDAQRAIRFVRQRCREWDVSPDRIGILGFSAGGHLSSTISNHWNYIGQLNDNDALAHISARPDLHVLIYPLITFSGIGSHPGCTKNLLGDNPQPDLIELLSMHRQVSRATPPAFLAHSTTDHVVPVVNSDLYAAALRNAGVPCVYIREQMGEHGCGLIDTWSQPCLDWLRKQGF